jgi:hypothetical protein
VTVTTEGGRVTNDETGERWYLYPPTDEQLDSVTWVISVTNAKPWLKDWYGSTSMAWALDNMALLKKTLAAEGREAALGLGNTAAKALRDIKREAGTYVHDVQQALILWAASPGRTGTAVAIPLLPDHLTGALYDGEPIEAVIDAMITGFMQFVTDFSPVFLATEMAVYNQPLGVAGTLDSIFELHGYAIHPLGDRLIPCPGGVVTACADTKTGKDPEGTWKEQLAAYRRMTECRLPLGEMHPMPATDCGMVLHLRPEYPDGYLLMLVAGADDEAAWQRFQSAARIYRDRQAVKDKPGKVVRALRPDGTMPGPRICDMAGEGYGRALSPLAKALGADAEIADLARFTRADLRAVKGIGPKLLDLTCQMLAGSGLSLAGDELAPVLAVLRDTAGPAVSDHAGEVT